MKARKFIEKKTEGEYEIIKNHVIEITDVEDVFDWICDKTNLADDDGEYIFNEYGLIFDCDGEVHIVDISKFIKGIPRFLETDEYFEEEDIDKVNEILEKLKKYEGYDIYL
jgi:hypothetical protein